ncbi:MAG: DNA cytosine methyltransferase, partial [Duncaniella sp.]|nr:DNA cytosine methyltransferase [Duncaniella sp.]
CKAKASKKRLFFGAKAKLECHAGDTDSPVLCDNIIQILLSGLRVKPGTYFPALVAITQTSIVGKRRRFLTPRECARLQSFPDTFIYDDKKAQAYKQFGNSINVDLVKLFARFMFGDPDIQDQYSYATQYGGGTDSLFSLF